jgi:hypothetical protein
MAESLKKDAPIGVNTKMPTDERGTADFSQTITVDNVVLWRHAEQSELLSSDQNEAYFDLIMRVRRHRPLLYQHSDLHADLNARVYDPLG